MQATKCKQPNASNQMQATKFQKRNSSNQIPAIKFYYWLQAAVDLYKIEQYNAMERQCNAMQINATQCKETELNQENKLKPRRLKYRWPDCLKAVPECTTVKWDCVCATTPTWHAFAVPMRHVPRQNSGGPKNLIRRSPSFKHLWRSRSKHYGAPCSSLFKPVLRLFSRAIFMKFCPFK